MSRRPKLTHCNCNCNWKKVAKVLCFLFAFGCVGGIMILYFSPQIDKVCHPRVGCFDLSGPWRLRPRLVNYFPQSPTAINTSFTISSRDPWTGLLDTRTIYYPFLYPTAKDFRWGKTDLVIFITHGYTDSSRTWMRSLQEALLSLGDITVVLVDWSTGAAGSYPQAIANTRVVSREISIFISHLVRREFTGLSSSLARKRFHLIGHSLGAQISSYVGKSLKQPEGTIYQITALDPAYPCFEGFPPEIRLHKNDARHVVVIHSNVSPWGFGMKEAVGTVDIYLNNGRDQRGCRSMSSIIKAPLQLGITSITLDAISHITDLIACSHRRAYEVLEDILRSLRRHASMHGGYVAYPMVLTDENNLESASIKYSYCQREFSGCWTLTFNKDDYFFQLPKPSPSSFFSQSTAYFMPTTDTSPFCSRMGYLEILTCPERDPLLRIMQNIEVTIHHIAFGDEVTIFQGQILGLQRIRAWIDIPCASVHNVFNSNGELSVLLSVSYKERSQEESNKSNAMTHTESDSNPVKTNSRRWSFCWSEMHLTYYDQVQKEFVKLRPCKSPSKEEQEDDIVLQETQQSDMQMNDQCFRIQFTSRVK